MARCRGRTEDSAPTYASSSPAVPRQSTKRIRCAPSPCDFGKETAPLYASSSPAVPRQSTKRIRCAASTVHKSPRLHDFIQRSSAHEPCITCEGQASMPWFEEITAQRDTRGGVACSNLLCLPVRHILSLPSDAAQPTQVPRAKEDARELYAATVSVYPLYETTRQEGDGWPVGGQNSAFMNPTGGNRPRRFRK